MFFVMFIIIFKCIILSLLFRNLRMFDSDINRISSNSNNNPNVRDAIAIDIGTSKCRISICKDQHVQIVEHGKHFY